MAGTAKTVLVDAYLDSLKAADPAALDRVLASGFFFQLPQPALELPRMERADAITFLTTAPGSFLETQTLNFHKVNVVETASDYVVELRVTANLKKGGVYDNLYILWFSFSEGKILSCREHADTAYAQRVAA